MIRKITIATNKEKEIIDITEFLQKELEKSKIKEGICHILLKHTTAAITTADLDPGGTDLDYLDALQEMVPKLKYRHPHNPEHMPEHILSSVIGTSLAIPFQEGKLELGTWQRIVLIEFDGPREREIIVSLVHTGYVPS